MNNKYYKKVQFGKWCKKSYREIRKNINNRIEKEFDIKLKK